MVRIRNVKKASNRNDEHINSANNKTTTTIANDNNNTHLPQLSQN